MICMAPFIVLLGKCKEHKPDPSKADYIAQGCHVFWCRKCGNRIVETYE